MPSAHVEQTGGGGGGGGVDGGFPPNCNGSVHFERSIASKMELHGAKIGLSQSWSNLALEVES